MNDHGHNLMRDLAIVALSVVVAIILVKTGSLESILTATREMRILGSFVSGVFFVSVFTAAPATAALITIAEANSIWLVAAIGALGALLGDLIIFRFLKDRLAEDLAAITWNSKWTAIARSRYFNWLAILIGALVVASPLPDELGLMMMGLSKMKTPLFVPISFLLNFIGILAIGLVARAF